MNPMVGWPATPVASGLLSTTATTPAVLGAGDRDVPLRASAGGEQDLGGVSSAEPSGWAAR